MLCRELSALYATTQLITARLDLHSVLEAISRPAERVRTWEEYRTALLTERRVNEGVET